MANVVQFPTRDAGIWLLMEEAFIAIMKRQGASQEMQEHVCDRMKKRYMDCCGIDGFQCSGSEQEIRHALINFFHEIVNNLLLETLHLEIDLYNATYGRPQ